MIPLFLDNIVLLVLSGDRKQDEPFLMVSLLWRPSGCSTIILSLSDRNLLSVMLTFVQKLYYFWWFEFTFWKILCWQQPDCIFFLVNINIFFSVLYHKNNRPGWRKLVVGIPKGIESAQWGGSLPFLVKVIPCSSDFSLNQCCSLLVKWISFHNDILKIIFCLLIKTIHFRLAYYM